MKTMNKHNRIFEVKSSEDPSKKMRFV